MKNSDETIPDWIKILPDTTKDYDALHRLASQLMSVALARGGGFALRKAFTKEMLESLLVDFEGHYIVAEKMDKFSVEWNGES